MPRHKINRSIEEEIEFQRRRRERQAENQRRRQQITKVATSSSHNLSKIQTEQNILLLKRKYAEKQSRYRSRIKNQPRLNINDTTLLNEIIEYYIGPMNVSCIHCNAKHFAAEKIVNKGISFHDCCNHGAYI